MDEDGLLVIMDGLSYTYLNQPTDQGEPEMNTDVTATDSDVTATVRTSAHADCDHPKTKAARAACRRARASVWFPMTRENAAKGDNVRVSTTVDAGVLEGQLLGWGDKRLILLVDEKRVLIASDAVILVEGRA